VEKGGLLEALGQAGLGSWREAWHSDEMRLGLRGQTRKVLAPKGVKVVQRLQLVYEWSYLVLAVSPLTGEIKWEWIERMRQEYIRPVLDRWALEAVVWDKAPSHRAKSLSELGTARVFLPSYSPELNPAERIFEEVRRRVEGKVYESLRDKRREAETYLKELAADPERVKSLCGWGWLRELLESPPSCPGDQ
jgi:transposase